MYFKYVLLTAFSSSETRESYFFFFLAHNLGLRNSNNPFLKKKKKDFVFSFFSSFV